MSNFQGLLNAVGLGAGAMNQTALDNHIMRQAAAMNNSTAIYGIGGSGGSLGGALNSTFGSAQQALPSQPFYILSMASIVKDPNRIASMCMPLTALVDLWRVKWGDTWLYDRVLPPVEDLDLWSMAAIRSHANNKFEIVAQYFRLREDA